MATAPELSNEQLVQELSDLTDGLSEVQDGLEKKLRAALREGGDALEAFYKQEFHLNKPLIMSIWLPQIKLVQKLGVSSQEEMDEFFKSRYGDAKVRDAHQDWLSVEEGWEDFLKNSVDKNLNAHYAAELPTSIDPCKTEHGTTNGGYIVVVFVLATVHVFDCDSDKTVTLRDYLKTPYTDVQQHFQGLSDNVKKDISIVIVCAGSTEGGRHWRQQTGINQFPILADSNHEVLDTFKFRRSTWNTCRASYGRNVFFEIKQMNVPIKIESLGERVEEVIMPDQTHDIHQMGGTIVMGVEGKIHYLHQTTTSTDRPPAAEVFAAITNA